LQAAQIRDKESGMAKQAKEKYLVLMVDDSEDDCLLLKMAMGKAERLNFIGSVSDGEELVDYLNGSGKYEDRARYPLPDMLLLDLMMPRKNGFEVLEWLRQQPFEDMVVVVLSGSEQSEDVKKALDMGADLFQTKEASPKKRLELVKVLEEFLTQKG
jgi:CheY-like chemotaxis protein